MSIRVFKASPGHAGSFASLHRACFEESWSEDAFRRLMNRPGALAMLACVEAETDSQAFILVHVAADECEILTLGTAENAQRRGLARALLSAAAEEAQAAGARAMFLEVAEDNIAAIALYRAAGFALIGRRQNYYRRADGSVLDAVMLRATLPLNRCPD